MNYIDLFGQYTVPPSEAEYSFAPLTVNSTLAWPNNFSGQIATEFLATTSLDIAANAGLTLSLPPANQVSVGTELRIRNVGANTIAIQDSTGAGLTTVATGAVKYFQITDNSTAAGTWATYTFGTGTSGADAVALAGDGLKVIANKLHVDAPYRGINSSYTVQSSDRAHVLNVVAGSLSLALPAATSLSAGFYVLLRNSSAGSLSIEPDGSELIDGAMSKTLAPQESLILIDSGTGWVTVGFGKDATFVFSEVVVNAAVSPVTLTSADVAGRMIRVSGVASGNLVINLPSIDNVYFVNVESGVGSYSVTLTTGSGVTTILNANQKTVVYCDGTNVTPAVTTTVTATLSLTDGSALAPAISWALDTDTGFYRNANGVIGFSSNGVGSLLFGSYGIAFVSGAGLAATNVFSALDELKNLVGTYDTTTLYSASQVLTAAQSGSLIVLTGTTASTFTLPDTSTLTGKGGRFSFFNTSTQNLVIQRAGTNTIVNDQPANVTSITLIPGDTVDLVSDTGIWYEVFGSFNAVKRTGSTMTGALTLSGNAVNALHAVPKQQLDVVAALAGSLKSYASYSASQTIADNQVGTMIALTGSTASTFTIPQKANVAAGSVLGFVNLSTANLTIQRAGSDAIVPSTGGVASITLLPGDTVLMCTTLSSSQWIVFAGSYGMLRKTGGQVSGVVTFATEYDNGNSGTSKTIDFANGQKQKITFTGNCTLTFAFPPGVANYVLRGIGNGTTYTLTWPAGTKFTGGVAPLAPLTSGTAIYTVYYDGTVAHVSGGRE